MLELVPLDRGSEKSHEPVSPARSLVKFKLSPKLSNSDPRVALRDGKPGSSDEVVEVVATLEVGVPPDPEEVGVIEGGYPPMGGSPHPLPATPRLVSFMCVT